MEPADRSAALQKVARGLGPLRLRYVPPWLRPSVKQEIFLRLPHEERFYGGAAGPGKSTAGLMALLQYADVPGYAALVIRQTYAQLTREGALVDMAHDWLDSTDAKWVGDKWRWTFPSGATLSFGHLQHPDAKRNYQGSNYHRIFVDEVTDLAQSSYLFLRSRIRRPIGIDEHGYSRDLPASPDGLTAADVPIATLAASNPGGPGHAWVRARFVNPETRAPGVAYVPAHSNENPGLDQEAYNRMLDGLGVVDRARLKGGDWTIQEEGTVFKRPRIELATHADLAALRAGGAVQSIRWWDMAATEQSDASPDPDWTVGLRIDRDRNTGSAIVADVVRARVGPNALLKLIEATAQDDGRNVTIGVEQEGGSAGKTVVDLVRRRLPGFHVIDERPTGDKETRARPVAADMEAKVVAVLEAHWTADFLDELEVFGGDSAQHDDQVDGLSGAWNNINRAASAAVIPMIGRA